jgi:hypothetical protein
MLMKMYAANAVEVSAGPSRFTVELSQRPVTSRLVRKQLETTHVVVNQLHRLVEIRDHNARRLLRLADGTRTLDELQRDLVAALQADVSGDALTSNLRNAARAALLVG